ncbi:MAG: GNAT family N-acetyltransferase [Devosia sp.]
MVFDLGHGYRLRPATAEDRPALEMVCLKTGDAGQDATAREDDPRLLGLIYAVPYQVFAPDYAFVVEGPNGVAGYVLGAIDSTTYFDWAAREWFPKIAATVDDPGPDQDTWRGSDWARRDVHHPDSYFGPALHAYPAHGHIDLLPEVQGKGIGRKALQHLIDKLRADGARGMHLGVSKTNAGALAFYEKLGFTRLTGPDAPDDAVYMLMTF